MGIREEQLQLLSDLDAMLATLDRYGDINVLDVFNTTSISINPFDFLINIIKKKVGDEELLEWLTSTITSAIPSIETAIKGVLLANIKSNIACGVDPYIPLWLRDVGFDFNPQSIDFTNKFKFDPLSKYGQYNYFGVSKYYKVDGDNENNKYYKYEDAYLAASKIISENNELLNTPENIIQSYGDINNYYEMARATDFDAFLWFVQNKCLIPYNTDNNQTLNANSELGIINLTDNESKYKLGSMIKPNKHLCYLCINEKYSDNNKINTFIPFTNEKTNSANWYTNKDYYFNNTLHKNNQNRKYDKEFPICNISNNSETNLSLQFKVCRAPSIHFPKIGDKKISITKFLFDNNLKPNKNGCLSVELSECNDPIDGIYEYTIKDIPYDTTTLIYNSTNGEYYFNIKNDNIILKDIFYECYPGLTIYDLNYDLIMSMQLFDSKILASEIVNNALYGFSGDLIAISPHLTQEEIAFRYRIMDIVDNIINQDVSEVSDCYYEFSNSKYVEMLKNTENKYYNNISFNFDTQTKNNINIDNVYDILKNITTESTLQENKDIIYRAFNELLVNVTEEVPKQSRYSVKVDIITNLIKSLSMSIITSILSPKIILLFELNKKILQSDSKIFTFDEFLSSIMNTVVSIIVEIRNYLLQILLDWALKIINQINEKIIFLLTKEQLDFYVSLLKKLMSECSLSINTLNGDNLIQAQLDMVNYADIIEDYNNTNNEIKLMKNC